MAFVVKDRVKESSTTTGTGSYSLDGAETGFQTFAAIGDGNSTYYGATDGVSWEVGIGTYSSAGTILSRDTILSSSNSNNAVNWSAGEKLIFATQPADKAVFLDSDGKIASGVKFAGYLDLSPISHPSHAEGRIFYDSEHKALAVYNDEADITLEVGQELHLPVLNNSGSTIYNGQPVFISGSSSGMPTIALADASSDTAYDSVGLATHDIENDSTGYVTVYGIVRDIDTSALTVGSHAYVGLTAGTLTSTAPVYPNYPIAVGVVVVSHATSGSILAYKEPNSLTTLRVGSDAHIGNDLVVGGNLTVQGTQTVAATENVAVGGAFTYLNAGDTIGQANTIFSGIGVNDGYFTGHYNGPTSKTFYVAIDGEKTGTAGVDTFTWSYNSDMSSPEATGVDMSVGANALANNISITFATDKNHTLGDKWSGAVAPINQDTGIFTNYNTGASGIGYTHTGIFWDSSAQKWVVLSEYDPEPEGTIDVTHASAVYGTFKAQFFEGFLNGVSSTTYALNTARTISLSGDVTGSVSFDGTNNVSIVSTVVNDSHSHDTQYVQLGGSTMTGQLGLPSVNFGDWTITENAGSLYFSYQGTNKFKLDNTGTLAVTNDVLTDATIS